MPELLEWQPDIVANGELRPQITRDAVWILFQTIHEFRRRISALEMAPPATSGNVTVSGATVTWIDVDLTGNYNVPVPSVTVDALVIWRFYQNGGPWTVTWPGANFPDAPIVGDTANKYNYVAMRARPSSKFEIVFAGHQNGTP